MSGHFTTLCMKGLNRTILSVLSNVLSRYIFIFTLLCGALKRFFEGAFSSLHKTILRYSKKVWKWKFTLIFYPLLGLSININLTLSQSIIPTRIIISQKLFKSAVWFCFKIKLLRIFSTILSFPIYVKHLFILRILFQ